MNAAAASLNLAPPRTSGGGTALLLALAAHALLLAALSLAVQWHAEPDRLSVQAELWSPQALQAAPAPTPQAEADPPPEPKPAPVPVAPAGPTEAEIAIERAAQLKKAQAKETERRAQIERDKAAKEAAAQLKRDQDRKRLEAQQKSDALVKAKRAQEKENKLLEKLRQENLTRMAGLAGATGAADAKGSAQYSAGPSVSYAARITARVKPKIVFSEDIAGNPNADVEVHCAPDGTITGRKLVKSSGNAGWDEAVLKAIDKTERLPRDADGSIYPSLVIGFRPKD